MIYTFTGHRPDKLGGYDKVTYEKLITFAKAQLENLKPKKCISGMALGWDLAAAAACESLKIPYIAAIPFPEQAQGWNHGDQFIWNHYKQKAYEVVTVCLSYSKDAYQKRNEWMVDHADCVIALHDGSPGGTNNTVKYANKVGKPLVNWWSDYLIYQDPHHISKHFT